MSQVPCKQSILFISFNPPKNHIAGGFSNSILYMVKLKEKSLSNLSRSCTTKCSGGVWAQPVSLYDLCFNIKQGMKHWAIGRMLWLVFELMVMTLHWWIHFFISFIFEGHNYARWFYFCKQTWVKWPTHKEKELVAPHWDQTCDPGLFNTS